MAGLSFEEQAARNAKNAAQLPDRDQSFARDTKGMEQANSRHVQRQDEMGKRPSGNASTNPLPLQQGLKQAREVTDVLKEEKKR